MRDDARGNEPPDLPVHTLVVRGGIGGTLMGLANLVPGISGGTMLLAAGVYPQFVQSVADLTTLRFKPRSVLTIAIVTGAATLGIVLLAGLLKDLVVHQRWIMYSLFIGLTLGGLPLVWKLARPIRASVWWGAGAGFAGMAALAMVQSTSADGGGASGAPMLFLAGLAGAAAMILPGLSGGYLLLLLGQYVPILSALDRFKDALTARDLADAFDVGLRVLTPVGIGVIAGVVVVSNLMRYLLERFRQPTLGVLVGLLLGAVVGLWPFREPVEPEIGSRIKGVVVTEESLAAIDPEDYPTAGFSPNGGHVGMSLALVALGLATTWGVSRLDGEEDNGSTGT